MDALYNQHRSGDFVSTGGISSNEYIVGPIWPVYEFGPFVADSRSRSIVCNGAPVSIGGRAFKILLMLLSSPGKAFSKNEILGRVWPSVFVAEDNVKVQIRHLRKSLGQYSDLVICVSGDGYVFTGQVAVR